MRKIIAKIKYLRHTIYFHLPFVIGLSYAILVLFMLIIIYNSLNNQMISNYIKMADGSTNLMSDCIDLDKIDYYIDENYSSDEYNNILKKLYRIKDNYPDILYMYIYDFNIEEDKAARVIIDLDEEYTDNPPQDSIDWIGDIYKLDYPFTDDYTQLITENKPIYHAVHDLDGNYLFSYVKPLYKDNKYICSACVDFSMTELYHKNKLFILKLGILLYSLTFIIWLLFVHKINKSISSPINQIEKCIKNFKYDTIDERFDNLFRLENLKINTRNEIYDLYMALLISTKENFYYMDKYVKAKTNIKRKDKELNQIKNTAYKDTLTNVGNMNKYKTDIKELKDQFEKDNFTDFAIVMLDINNLKYINDTYGHSIGNKYIQGCCNIICKIFAHSPIYRIGGDEFIIIVKNDDFNNIDELISVCESHFNIVYSDKEVEDYKRYSMSLGMCKAKAGMKFPDIITLADQNMYSNKKKFKTKYGTYR